MFDWDVGLWQLEDIAHLLVLWNNPLPNTNKSSCKCRLYSAASCAVNETQHPSHVASTYSTSKHCKLGMTKTEVQLQPGVQDQVMHQQVTKGGRVHPTLGPVPLPPST